MTMKKRRKRAYIPPANEVAGRKDRSTQVSRTRTVHAKGAAGNRSARVQGYPEPSLQRTAKRLPVYFVMIFLLQFYLVDVKGDMTTADRAIGAAVAAGLVTVAFAPFMHLMDKWTYSRAQKRLGAAAPRTKG